MKRKLINTILILSLIIALIPAIPATVAYADGSGTSAITLQSSYVIVGNQTVVTVKFNATSGIVVAEFNLNYDSSKLDFVSTDGPAATNTPSGVIPYQWDDNTFPTSFSFTVTFKGKAVGDAAISISDATVVVLGATDTDFPSEVAMTNGSATIKVMAVGSDDATLQSLNIGGATLSPAFSKWTTDYTCYVANSVTSVDVSAVSSQGGNVVIGGDPHNLKVGSNYVTFTSYAPNGASMKYTVNIVRSEPPTETTTEAPTEPPTYEDERRIVVDDKNSIILDVTDQVALPEGFGTTTMNINGLDIVVAQTLNGSLTLAYVMDEETGSAKFMVYNPKDGSLTSYLNYSNSKKTYMILVMDDSFMYGDVEASESEELERTELSIGESVVDAYKLLNVDNLYIIRAMNSDNVIGYYYYNSEYDNIFPFFISSVPEPVEDDDDGNNENDIYDKEVEAQMDKQQINDLQYQLDVKDKQIKVLIAVIAAICVIVAAALIINKKKDKNHPEEESEQNSEEKPEEEKPEEEKPEEEGGQNPEENPEQESGQKPEDDLAENADNLADTKKETDELINDVTKAIDELTSKIAEKSND